MRFLPWLVLALVTVAVWPWLAPVRAQEAEDGFEYSIAKVGKVTSFVRQKDGKSRLYFSLQFQIKRTKDKSVVTSIPRDDIRIYEDNKEVLNLELLQPKNEPLTAILAIDISGSMERD